MGQKIHPIGFRLAVNRNWSSRWYADDKAFGGMLSEDIRVREYLKKKLKVQRRKVCLACCSLRNMSKARFYCG